MIKKTVTFENFEGEEVTKDFYFNISSLELVELAVDDDHVIARLQKTFNNHKPGDEIDKKMIVEGIKDLMLLSIGERTEDGEFLKDESIAKKFKNSEAFGAIIQEVCVDEPTLIEFFVGMFPRSAQRELAKAGVNVPDAKKATDVALPDSEPEKPKKPSEMTREELIAAMKVKNAE